MTLKVLTLNIWNNSGPWPARGALIREWIERLDPDLIGFQEVLRGPGLDQLAELAPGAFHTDYAKAVAFWDDNALEFGNAVATRWPITDREVAQLPDKGDGERRVALNVTVDSPLGPISFTSTHLNWKFHHGPVREKQVLALSDLVLRRRPREAGDPMRSGFPPIVVGDFNAEPDSSEIRFMTGLQSLSERGVYFRDAHRLAGDGAGITWSNRNDYARAALEPDRRIDYVFVGYPKRDGVGLVERARVVCDERRDGVWPSDHFGEFVELRTEPLQH